MKSLTPAQSLVLLILVGVAISGWLYGVHWKRVASGDLFSNDEKLMIRLQDQISSLSEVNADLNEQLKAYADETGVPDGEIKSQDPATVSLPAVPPVPADAPNLPVPPQKIETH